jgi:protein-L-isoaspartate(D-aspartate) O-methyltransferase
MVESPASHGAERAEMVQEQLIGRGIRDDRVLSAMRSAPRHLFVPETVRHAAYSDQPLPIGWRQTISQPLMVALLLQALELRGDENVLDVGTGSGYQAALLARLARRVVSVEIVPELAYLASGALERLRVRNVAVVVGDGGLGAPEAAPFDAIVVAAASPRVPPPLVSQLADGGRLVVPVGTGKWQSLVRIRRRAGELSEEQLGACAFVRLRGAHGE